MRAGELRFRVTLEQEGGPGDGRGGKARSWTTLGTVWANIVPLTGSEQLKAGQVTGNVSHRIEIRYLADVTSKLRVVFGTRVFTVRAVIDVGERKTEMHLLCDEDKPATS